MVLATAPKYREHIENSKHAKFNEALIIDKHHQNLRKAKSLMRDLEQGFKETSVLVVDNYKNYEFVLQTVKDDQKHQITQDPTKPAAEFLSSLRNPNVPHLGLSPIYLDSHAPPSFTAQPPPDSSLPVTLEHPELRSYVPHLSPTIFPGSYAPPSVIARPPSPDSTPPVTLKHSALRLGLPYRGVLLNPRYSVYPGLMRPRSLLSINGPRHHIARFSYSPSSTGTASNRPQVLYTGPPLKVHVHDENPHELKTFSPAISPSITLSSKTPPRFTTSSRTVDVNAKMWQEEIDRYIHGQKILKVSNDTASSQSRGRSTVPASRNAAEETTTANTAILLDEDQGGFPYFTSPETTTKTTHDPKNNSMTITVGDVLYGNIVVQLTPPPKKPYIDEMEQLNEGYLMFFFIEMCRLISLKNTTVVITTFHHMENIFNQKFDDGEISWIPQPLLAVIFKLLTLTPEKNVAIIKTQCSMMFNMLLERKTVLSSEVNFLIQRAETILDVEDGERLLYALKNFEDYPNTNKTLYEICDDLLTNLIAPFLREAGNQQHYPVLKSFNNALMDRFPELEEFRVTIPTSGTHEETVTTEESIVAERRKRMRKQHNKKQKRKAPPRQLYDMNM